MADDELDEDFDPEAIEGDLVEDLDEELDEEGLEGELDDEELGEGDEFEGDAEADDEAEEEGDAAEVAARSRKRRETDEDEDEDDLNPDDVEADLDTILKDRIAAGDDEDEEELDEDEPRAAADAPDGVVPKRANEFVCTGCFLLVNRAQFGPADAMQCPVGESLCPAIEQLQDGGAAPVTSAKATKATKAPAKASARSRKR